jgi:DNA-binding XRE family transcriptional regulator
MNEQNEAETNAVLQNSRSPMRPPMRAKQRTRAEVIINGELVRARRKALQFTQYDLAIAASCSPRTITQIERGKALDPPTSITLRLAKALSVTVEALTKGAQPYSSRTVVRAVSDPEDHV